MSLAYPPRLVKYLFKSAKERNAAQKSSMKSNFFGHFPRSFGLYFSGLGDDFLSLRFHLSTATDDPNSSREDMYAITFNKGPGTRQMILYPTADHGGAPLAVATTEKRYGSSATIKLPGATEGASSTERLRYTGFVSDTYQFSLHGDTFELREGKGRPKTRTLVKLLASSEDPGGAETMATWREGSVPNRDGRLAGFSFVSEEAAQEMGEYGTLLAISAILIACQQGDAIECECWTCRCDSRDTC